MKTKRKSPAIAFLLSFLLPGLGLFYLRLWKKGVINLGLLLIVSIISAVLFRHPNLFLATLVGIASGGWAQLLADEINAKAIGPKVSFPQQPATKRRAPAVAIRREERKELIVGTICFLVFVALVAAAVWKDYRHRHSPEAQRERQLEAISEALIEPTEDSQQRP